MILCALLLFDIKFCHVVATCMSNKYQMYALHQVADVKGSNVSFSNKDRVSQMQTSSGLRNSKTHSTADQMMPWSHQHNFDASMILWEIRMSCCFGVLQSLLLSFDPNFASATAQSEASCVCELACLVCLRNVPRTLQCMIYRPMWRWWQSSYPIRLPAGACTGL